MSFLFSSVGPLDMNESIYFSTNTTTFRSMIGASKGHHCKQIAIPHSDITGLTVQIGKRRFLIISVYIPCSSGRVEIDQQNLATRLRYIYQALEGAKSQHPETALVLTGDFNRWDFHWGGDFIGAHSRQGEGAGLIDFMSDLGLIQLLQRGTQTYHSPLGTSSTIDLVFTSKRLARSLLECKLYNTHHGSDHEAIETHFDLIISEATHTPRSI